jgi:hypothetical protein
MATRCLLFMLFLFHAICGMASAQDVRTIPRTGTASRLRVDIVFDGPPIPKKLEASAMEEVTKIWAAYGVDVHMSNPSDVLPDGAIRLAVMFADHPDEHTAVGALGSIVFLDDGPVPAIVMYPRAIAALVSTVRLLGSNDKVWPKALYDLVTGRVLGRALAHEIGHFLLRLRGHSRTGLMRPRHQVPDLIGAGRSSFVLSAEEVARLVSVPSTSFPSSTAAARLARTPDR